MSEYDERGKVALWKPETDNPKAPQAKGRVVAHRDIKEGEELDIALWRNQSDNPKAPVMTGKLSDKREQQAQPSGGEQQSAPPADNSDFDSDIPF